MTGDRLGHALRTGWAVTCLLGPLAGWVSRKLWNRYPNPARILILAACWLSLLATCCWIFTPWSIRGYLPNVLNISFSYLALFVLLWLSFRNHGDWFRKIGPIVGWAIFAGAALVIFSPLAFVPMLLA